MGAIQIYRRRSIKLYSKRGELPEGTNYSNSLRRTIHVNSESFGAPSPLRVTHCQCHGILPSLSVDVSGLLLSARLAISKVPVILNRSAFGIHSVGVKYDFIIAIPAVFRWGDLKEGRRTVPSYVQEHDHGEQSPQKEWNK